MNNPTLADLRAAKKTLDSKIREAINEFEEITDQQLVIDSVEMHRTASLDGRNSLAFVRTRIAGV